MLTPHRDDTTGESTGESTGERAEELARQWVRQRGRLVGVAYAVLGSRAEAEDVVADCWLRLVGADAAERVRDVEAWATVAVARRALDVLRSARSRRESYVGPWLPEPLVTGDPVAGGAAAGDPADRVTLDERVSYALMVVLETLTPAERTAWVLHELFGVPFADVARAVGRSPAAVRQLAGRARAHVAAGAGRVEVDPGEHRRVTAAFLAATAGGDLGALLALLDPAVVLTSDGGGVVSAARRSVHGADRVARFLAGLARKHLDGAVVRVVRVNGGPGFAVADASGPVLVGALTVVSGTVRRVDLVLAPAKLPTDPPPAPTGA
ncbi:RNA polymerase sigma factor SigJ [Kineococcus auxinigenes]|uniref:RNA polymerase sigma factor SigJ n=1 Tax=unclassified Kineococcus TaxID=2621656 RepID=UPI003D7C7604